ncbi:hypothetical protein FHQ20_07950, partial [Pasteurellaceae bacterium USgator41]
MKKLVLTWLVCVVLAGCSTTIPVNYTASPVVKGIGDVAILQSRYVPYEKGEVEVNEIQKKSLAIGTIKISSNVDDFFTKALQKEFIASGVEVTDNSRLKVIATINQLLNDWIGTHEDYYLKVNYELLKDDKLIYSKEIETHIKSGKNSNFVISGINLVVSDNIG